MADARSKVTLRPRSKLERVVESLGDGYEIPPRPHLDVLSQLALSYLLECGTTRRDALSAMKPLCGKNGWVEGDKLISATAEDLSAVGGSDTVEGTLACLRASGKLDGRHPGGLSRLCAGELGEARRTLASLPGMGAWRADLLLLSSGSHAVVAPTAIGRQVAARLGYPGVSYEAVARALDAELPPDAIDIAWKAHHLLDLHGKAVCAKLPTCAECPVQSACAYGGKGSDPAARLVLAGDPSAEGGEPVAQSGDA